MVLDESRGDPVTKIEPRDPERADLEFVASLASEVTPPGLTAPSSLDRAAPLPSTRGSTRGQRNLSPLAYTAGSSVVHSRNERAARLTFVSTATPQMTSRDELPATDAMALRTRAAHVVAPSCRLAFITASHADACEDHDSISVVVAPTVTPARAGRAPDARRAGRCRERERRAQCRRQTLDRRREHPYRASDDLTAVHVALE